MFQALVLLLRDWTDDQEDAGYESFKCGYYDEYTTPAGQEKNLMQMTFFPHQDNTETRLTFEFRKTILNSFKTTAMYLMAHPGLINNFPMPNEPHSKNWYPKFRECVEDFIDRTLAHSELSRY